MLSISLKMSSSLVEFMILSTSSEQNLLLALSNVLPSAASPPCPAYQSEKLPLSSSISSLSIAAIVEPSTQTSGIAKAVSLSRWPSFLDMRIRFTGLTRFVLIFPESDALHVFDYACQ